jgi:hypothetical protein
VISSSQRPLPYNTQQSQETYIHALGGIRTHDPSKRAAIDPRLRPRGHWDRLLILILIIIKIIITICGGGGGCGGDGKERRRKRSSSSMSSSGGLQTHQLH